MGTDAREHGDAHARPERVRQINGLQSALARTRQDLLRVRDDEHLVGVRRRRGRVRRRLRRLGLGRLAHAACRADDLRGINQTSRRWRGCVDAMIEILHGWGRRRDSAAGC